MLHILKALVRRSRLTPPAPRARFERQRSAGFSTEWRGQAAAAQGRDLTAGAVNRHSYTIDAAG